MSTDLRGRSRRPDRQHSFSKFYVPVKRMSASVAVKKWPTHTLLIVWPTYDDPWSLEVLKATKAEHVVYVGEDLGGCCATDRFFEYLGEHFDVLYADNVPQWPTRFARSNNCFAIVPKKDDRLWIYRRK